MKKSKFLQDAHREDLLRIILRLRFRSISSSTIKRAYMSYKNIARLLGVSADKVRVMCLQFLQGGIELPMRPAHRANKVT
jgi:transposase